MTEVHKDPAKAVVVILGFTFKENCPDIRNTKVMDLVKRLRVYGVEPVVVDLWADAASVKKGYGVTLTPFDEIPKADCIIVAVGHKEFRAMSVSQLGNMFKSELPDHEKVLLDAKSLYRIDELSASGMRFWRL